MQPFQKRNSLTSISFGFKHLFLFFVASLLTGCSACLRSESTSSQQVFRYKGKVLVVSLAAKSKVKVVGYHLSDSKLLFVLACKNISSEKISFNPQHFKVIGLNAKMQKRELSVNSASVYEQESQWRDVIEKSSRWMAQYGEMATMAVSTDTSRFTLTKYISRRADTYTRIADSSVDMIYLYQQQDVCGSVVVDVNADFVERFELLIPIGEELHSIAFSGR